MSEEMGNALINKLIELDELTEELYEFRFVYNCFLFNIWNETGEVEVYKSKKHHDGEPCFDGDYFIVVALLPTGQITNHYPMEYWDSFNIPIYEQVKDEFDGHSSKDVLERLNEYLKIRNKNKE